jgi:hypothetical protein
MTAASRTLREKIRTAAIRREFMKLFAAAFLACALPAFGQGVREQLATRLHETCVAHAQETLRGRWHIAAALSFDTPKFCACADESIQRDRVLERIARMPESGRQPSSGPATMLDDHYFFDGLECYSKTVGWPPNSSTRVASRSLEEIRAVLERRKGAVYALYNRALKGNPKLVGAVVLEFTIEPAGDVRDVSVRSGELTDPAFLDALKSLVETLKFPDEPVAKLVATYPMDFLPN